MNDNDIIEHFICYVGFKVMKVVLVDIHSQDKNGRTALQGRRSPVVSNDSSYRLLLENKVNPNAMDSGVIFHFIRSHNHQSFSETNRLPPAHLSDSS
jgi:hypothetical protein